MQDSIAKIEELIQGYQRKFPKIVVPKHLLDILNYICKNITDITLKIRELNDDQKILYLDGKRDGLFEIHSYIETLITKDKTLAAKDTTEIPKGLQSFFGIVFTMSLDSYIDWLETSEGITHIGMIAKQRDEKFNQIHLELITNYNNMIIKKQF